VNAVEQENYAQRVYDVVKKIPSGKVMTYGQIALYLGNPKYARRVARAMSHAPAALRLPCHRVVNAGGGTAPGWPEQRTLLAGEGVAFKENGCVDIRKYIVKMEDLPPNMNE